MSRSRNTLLVIVALSLLAAVNLTAGLAAAALAVLCVAVVDDRARRKLMPSFLPRLPFGYELRQLQSEYHGHPDGLRYGDGPETVYLVVPAGSPPLPAVQLIHGGWVRCWQGLNKMPEGTRIFQDRRWMPVEEYIELYQSPGSFARILREMRNAQPRLA